MSFRRSVLAGVAGEKPRRPQLVGIAEVLRLPARQRHQPCLGLQRDRRFPAGARAIVERSHRAFGHGPLDAALDGLMMQPERPTYRKKRRVFPIGQQYPRPLDPARRFRSRLRDRSQLRHIRISERQFNRPPPRCHDLPPRSILGTRGRIEETQKTQKKSPNYDNFHGIDRLVSVHIDVFGRELPIERAGRRIGLLAPALTGNPFTCPKAHSFPTL